VKGSGKGKGKVHLRTGHEGSGGDMYIVSLFLQPRHLMGVGGQRHAEAALPPGKDPVPIVDKVGWAPGPAWTGAENLASHWDSIPGPSSP